MRGLSAILLRCARSAWAAVQNHGAWLVFAISIAITAIGCYVSDRLMLQEARETFVALVAGILISILLGLITWMTAASRARSAAADERLRFDIDKRQQLEQELRAKEESFRFLFQKSPNAMWLVDRETLRFLQVNEQAVSTYGYSQEEFLRMRIPISGRRRRSRA